MFGEKLLEKNLVPDMLVRAKIRSLLKARLQDVSNSDPRSFASGLREGPIAVATRAANEQHYEVPARFFELVLGPQLKYSCALFDPGSCELKEAEEKMLVLTAQRALLADGQDILELGCGWGSLSLWMAQRFPNARITAVSNSHSQKAFIDAAARARGLENLNVRTSDMNDFNIDTKFDRVVSVEMFEHMRNISALFQKIATFLKPDGRLFLHIFSHARHAYLFEPHDDSDWMARHFFTGGMMPSDDLYHLFNEDLVIDEQWTVDGKNYQRTAEAWLANMDAAKGEIMGLFAATYGEPNAAKWWAYWRVFFMSCAELWGFREGREWHVVHYLLRRSDRQ